MVRASWQTGRTVLCPSPSCLTGLGGGPTETQGDQKWLLEHIDSEGLIDGEEFETDCLGTWVSAFSEGL